MILIYFEWRDTSNNDDNDNDNDDDDDNDNNTDTDNDDDDDNNIIINHCKHKLNYLPCMLLQPLKRQPYKNGSALSITLDSTLKFIISTTLE